MSIAQRIAEDVKTAMKARATDRLGTLRMIKSKLQMAEVDLRAKKGRDYQLEDEQALQALSSYAKQRRDSIESFEKAGRPDLAAKERTELEVVQEYLPAQLGEDDVREIVKQAIAEVNASSPDDMGAVMKVVMPKVKGVADGKLVNQLVRTLLKSS
jgi:uncharacterized protein YqeY